MRGRWPNFFIVGAPRAGTTSLYEYLKRTPGVYMSPIKEPRYFSGAGKIRSEAEYLRLFRGARDAIAVGEASPGYLRHPEAPTRIRRAVPDARIIMILRDPVEQVYSSYFVRVRQTLERLSFEQAVRMDEHFQAAFYSEPARRYLDIFGAKRVKILIFEEFIREPRKAVSEVLKFLGVHSDPPPTVGKIYNYSYTKPRWRPTAGILQNNLARTLWRALLPAPLRETLSRQVLYTKSPKPPMAEESRRYLEQVFRDDVQRLEKILGRPLPWFHRKEASPE